MLTKQAAYEQAVEYRKQKDLELGCTNGIRPSLGLKSKRKAEAVPERLTKRVTIKEYFTTAPKADSETESEDSEVETATD